MGSGGKRRIAGICVCVLLGYTTSRKEGYGMNSLQKYGLFGSLLGIIAGMVGVAMRGNVIEYSAAYRAWGMVAGVGFIVLLLSLLVFAAGRMVGEAKK